MIHKHINSPQNYIKKMRGFRYHFSCSHYYWNPHWDENQNRETFGLCAQKMGHGHDYTLDVLLPEENTDWIRAKSVLQKIVDSLDHQNLNTLPTFKERIPTTEALAEWLGQEIIRQLHLPEIKLKLKESDSLWVCIDLP